MNYNMGNRYYKLITEHASPGLILTDVDEILNKYTAVGCIESIQYFWELEHKYVSSNVEPFYKYALKEANHN